jgi:hypothetical protein
VGSPGAVGHAPAQPEEYLSEGASAGLGHDCLLVAICTRSINKSMIPRLRYQRNMDFYCL